MTKTCDHLPVGARRPTHPEGAPVLEGRLAPAGAPAHHGPRGARRGGAPGRGAGGLGAVRPVQDVVEVVAHRYVLRQRLEDLVVVPQGRRQGVHVVLLEGGLRRLRTPDVPSPQRHPIRPRAAGFTR